MKTLILRGKFKGAEVEISQWCNDWFTLDPRKNRLFDEDKKFIMQRPFKPSALAFTEGVMEVIKQHKNNGQMFEWFEVTELKKPVKTRNGIYKYTFQEKKKALKQYISFAQAYICLKVEDGAVHTFRQGGIMLIGADWQLETLIEAMKKYEGTLQLTGEMARKMEHGIVFFDEAGAVFVKTIEKELVELESNLSTINKRNGKR